MLVFGSAYIVLEAADGRLCLCSSFGQTVHGVMCGARVHGVAWVRGGVMVVGNSLWFGMVGPGRAAFTILSLEDRFLL